MSEIILNEGNFEGEVLRCGGIVVVDFWAQWCMPCQIIAPIISQLAEEYKEIKTLKICKLNVDEYPQIAERFGITSIPTLKFFKDGKEVAQIVGVVDKHQIKAKIDNLLKS